MSKSTKAQEEFKFGKQKKKDPKERYRKILAKYGMPSPRLGGYEYMVATNLMIFEQLKKMSKEDTSMLDY